MCNGRRDFREQLALSALTDNLPRFRYHPDPLATGSFEFSSEECQVCRKRTGFAYSGGLYTELDLSIVCPWCIADGSAHERFHVEFNDLGIGDESRGWEAVPQNIKDEVLFRTPGFSGWQQERWLAHCDDAAEFLGPVGKAELEQFGPDAIESIRRDAGVGTDWTLYLDSMDRQHGPATAYLFRCLKCGTLLGYSDCL
jgi:uncharacterized protein CbrC (UPF0167 family)